MAKNTQTNPVDGGSTDINGETAQAAGVRPETASENSGQPAPASDKATNNAEEKEEKAGGAKTNTNPKAEKPDGKKADTEAAAKASAGGAVRQVLTETLKEQEAFIAPYRKAYPKEKAFHITSDKQVFLEKDRSLAVLHQNSLKNGEKIQTIPANRRG